MNPEQLAENIALLREQMDEALGILRELQAKKKAKAAAKKSATKTTGLSPEETAVCRERFERLYEQWLGGDEVSAQAELEGMRADEVRRFADANNLNVTSRTPKRKCLELIAMRFREKRELTRGISGACQNQNC
jgi:hypothetical protein